MGRFCLNCGHRIGEPAPAPPATPAPAAPEPPVEPTALPVQAADPTPVPPVTPVRQESDWDPSEDLLPYEEVDGLTGDTPLRGRAWIAWVLGAVLLVGLVFVLLDAFGADGGDGGDAATDSSSSSATTDRGSDTPAGDAGSSEVPTGVGKRVQLAAGATFGVPGTAPPTTDLDGDLVAYEATQMHDADPSTTWRTAGDATGQALSVTLAEPAVVLRVGLVNGYTKQVAGVDWYPRNRRILAVSWTFEDGTSVEQTFAERPGLQMIAVPPVQTSTVDLQITSVTPPGSGTLGRDYTAISEVSIIGRRAG